MPDPIRLGFEWGPEVWGWGWEARGRVSRHVTLRQRAGLEQSRAGQGFWGGDEIMRLNEQAREG